MLHLKPDTLHLTPYTSCTFLKVSDDGTKWKDVECNRRFYTPWSGSDTVRTTVFKPSIIPT